MEFSFEIGVVVSFFVFDIFLSINGKSQLFRNTAVPILRSQRINGCIEVHNIHRRYKTCLCNHASETRKDNETLCEVHPRMTGLPFSISTSTVVRLDVRFIIELGNIRTAEIKSGG